MVAMQPFESKVADPGIGDACAAVGSTQWARWVRLHLQSAVKRVDKEPKHVAEMVDLLKQHRAWTVLNKPDGSFFATFEEFCEHKQPWGLGKPYEELRPFLEAAVGKRALELVTVAPDARKFREHAEDGTFSQTRHDVANGNESRAAEKKAERLRAITQAPPVIQEAYRAGLIGQDVAAKMGPRSPSPQQAAKIAQAAIDIAPIVASAKAKPERERRKVQREVNATVRNVLRPKALTSTPSLERAIALVGTLNETELRALLAAVRKQLGEVAP